MELLERVIKIESALPALSSREHVTQEVGALHTELHKEVGALRTELHKEIGSLRSELHKSLNDQTWKIIGTMITFGTLLSAIVYYIARNVK